MRNWVNTIFAIVTDISWAFIILLVIFAQASAGTGLKIDMDSCYRDVDEFVVCDFRVSSDSPDSNALTGGPYSQAQDDLGNVYDSTKVQIGEESGMAVFFEITQHSTSYGKLFFEGVDKATNRFQLVTMRFRDGGWQQENIAIAD